MSVTKPLSARLQVHFASLKGPRHRKVKYPFLNFIVVAICPVICGAGDFVAIMNFAHARKRWFRKILAHSGRIPSHDPFNAVFVSIQPAELERCPLSWITALHEVTEGQVVAMDGKTLRGSFDANRSKSATQK